MKHLLLAGLKDPKMKCLALGPHHLVEETGKPTKPHCIQATFCTRQYMPQTGTSSIQEESDDTNWEEWTDGAEQKCCANAGMWLACCWRGPASTCHRGMTALGQGAATSSLCGPRGATRPPSLSPSLLCSNTRLPGSDRLRLPLFILITPTPSSALSLPPIFPLVSF